jgi:hypothetical protein
MISLKEEREQAFDLMHRHSDPVSSEIENSELESEQHHEQRF